MVFLYKYKHLLVSTALSACLMCSTFHPYSCFAQPYIFSLDTGTYTDLSTPTSLNNNSTWDDPEYHIPIGFIFEFFNLSFDSIYISDYSDYMWFDDNKDYRIDAFSTDFIDRAYPDSSVSPISYKLAGTAGSYIFKIEWKNAGFYGEQSGLGTTDDFVNIQLWLYEGTNDIEIHIGPVSVQNPVYSYDGNGGATVGLSNTMLNEFIYLTDSANNPIPVDTSGFFYLTGTPSDGIIYKFCENPVADFNYSVDSAFTVSFSNSSVNVVNYFWDFGDDSTSTEQNPTHTYTDTGAYTVKLIVSNNCNTTDTAIQIITIQSTGINQYSLTNPGLPVNIYPNPVNNLLNLSFDIVQSEIIQIKIIDVIGRTIYEREIAGMNGLPNIVFDLTEFKSGVYFIQFKTGKVIYYERIIKQ